ncbi:hypothetical protein FRC09_008461 [Ceratobasidium sp. 395]|nr:hypothetical protein FRC09_008461 [Ceratobasidium sp. 395]
MPQFTPFVRATCLRGGLYLEPGQYLDPGSICNALFGLPDLPPAWVFGPNTATSSIAQSTRCWGSILAARSSRLHSYVDKFKRAAGTGLLPK